jgi:transglutaminase/protease-like cytokinesis protein 3
MSKQEIVQNYLDHCWNEALIGDKWIYVDSTLEYPISLIILITMSRIGQRNTTHFGFSYNSVDDVTSYTDEWQNVQKRRDKDNKENKM